MSEPLLTAEGLTLRFGTIPALVDVAIDISAGEVVAIVGRIRLRQDHAAARAVGHDGTPIPARCAGSATTCTPWARPRAAA